MAFRLQHHEPLPKGLLRVYLKQAAGARESCRGSEGATIRERVHDVRKRLKKMRAILRLVREEIGKQSFTAENHRLRDAGRLLSPLRDAEVRLETLNGIREVQYDGRPRFPRVHRVLAHQATLRAEEAPEALGAIINVLGEARRQASALDLSGFGHVELCGSLRRTYKKARAALARARDDDRTECLHELRKRAKDLWYDLRLLQAAFPEVLKEQARQLKALTERLGEFLDLHVLRTTLCDSTWENDTAAERKELLKVIDARQQELRNAALELARRFFSESNKVFAKRISGYVAEGRGDGSG